MKELINIFQSPVLLIIVSLISLAVIVLIRQIHPEKNHFWQLMIPIAILIAAFTLDHFIKTDTEKLAILLDNAKDAVVNENPNKLAPLIDPDYSDMIHDSKQQLMAFVNSVLNTPMFEKAKYRFRNFELSAPKATAVFEAVVHLEQQQTYPVSLFIVKMKIHFKRDSNKNWKITGSEILEVNNQSANWKIAR